MKKLRMSDSRLDMTASSYFNYFDVPGLQDGNGEAISWRMVTKWNMHFPRWSAGRRILADVLSDYLLSNRKEKGKQEIRKQLRLVFYQDESIRKRKLKEIFRERKFRPSTQGKRSSADRSIVPKGKFLTGPVFCAPAPPGYKARRNYLDNRLLSKADVVITFSVPSSARRLRASMSSIPPDVHTGTSRTDDVCKLR